MTGRYDDEFDLFDLVDKLIERWKLFMCVVLIGGMLSSIVAFQVSLRQTTEFEFEVYELTSLQNRSLDELTSVSHFDIPRSTTYPGLSTELFWLALRDNRNIYAHLKEAGAQQWESDSILESMSIDNKAEAPLGHPQYLIEFSVPKHLDPDKVAMALNAFLEQTLLQAWELGRIYFDEQIALIPDPSEVAVATEILEKSPFSKNNSQKFDVVTVQYSGTNKHATGSPIIILVLGFAASVVSAFLVIFLVSTYLKRRGH